jgi:hypothetical protein
MNGGINDKILDFLLVRIWKSDGALELLADAASCAIWMFVSLTLRAVLSLFGLLRYVPEGFVFSFPILMQYMSQKMGIQLLTVHSPLLPVRIAEVFMGRIRRKRLPHLIISHLLGCLFGLALFVLIYGCFTSQPERILLPIRSSFFGENDIYSSWGAPSGTNAAASGCCSGKLDRGAHGTGGIGIGNENDEECYAGMTNRTEAAAVAFYESISRVGSGWVVYHVLVDVIASFCFCCLVLVLPEMLDLNRVNRYYLSVATAAVLLLHAMVIGRSSLSAGMNPSAGATLWFVHTPLLQGQGPGPTSVAGAGAGSDGIFGVEGGGASALLPAAEGDVGRGVGSTQGSSSHDDLYPLLPNIHNLAFVRGVCQLFWSVLWMLYYYFVKSALFLEQCVGPLVGGAVAGIVCGKYAPDDSATWKRRVF